MKKIVSIVLALVLVLAIAAPAMAITGYVSPVTQATASAPYAIDMTLVSDDAAGLGLLGLTAIATNKAYVMNEVIYGRIDVAANTKTTWSKWDYNEAHLVISSNAVALQNAIVYSIGTGASDVLLSGANGSVTVVGQAKADALNVIDMNFGDTPINTTTLFSGVVQAQGSIVAELMGGNKQYFAGIKGTLSENVEYIIFNDLGEKLYGMKADGTNVRVGVYEKGSEIGCVYFVRDAKDICSAIYVSAAGVDSQVVSYSAPISNGGAIVEAIGTYTAADTSGVFKALKAVYDEVMAFFGFDYNAKGELLDAHFTSKLHSFYAKDEVAVNLYTSAITVPDPEVEIPQTGDAATTIGFVMVAMAIVAAAAVAYKKVRA